MKYYLITLVFALLTLTLKAQPVYNPNSRSLIEAPYIPFVSSVIIDYTNVYDNIDHAIYDFPYHWSQNNTHVTYEDQWNTYAANLDTSGNIIYLEEKSKTYPYATSQQSFEYDSFNRVIKRELSDTHKTIAYYTDSHTDSIIDWSYDNYLKKWLKTQKIEIHYSDTYIDHISYTYNNESCSYNHYLTNRNYLDSQGRIIQSIDLNSTAGSILEYNYDELGHTLLISYHGSNHAAFKHEYVYNENGDLIANNYYEWMNGSYWKPCIMSEYTYNYLDTAIYNVTKPENFIIYNNNIVFNLDNTVTITTLKGINIFHGKINSKTEIPLNVGETYIIRVNDEAYKIQL